MHRLVAHWAYCPICEPFAEIFVFGDANVAEKESAVAWSWDHMVSTKQEEKIRQTDSLMW